MTTTENELIDGSTSSCVAVVASPDSDWMITFAVTPGYPCVTNQKVKFNMNFKNHINCEIIKRLVFTDGQKCAAYGGFRSCRVVNPEDTGAWCEVECKCEGAGCNVRLVVPPGVSVPSGMEVCEVGIP